MPSDFGVELARSVNRRLTTVGYFANGVGGVVLMLFAGFFVPGTVEPHDYGRVALLNIGFGAPYLAIALPAGRVLIQNRGFADIDEWLRSGRSAGRADQLRALGLPRRWAILAAVPWITGTVLITLVNLTVSYQFAATIATIAVLGGAAACALQYLLVERAIRPVVAVALGGGPPPPTDTPGVTDRIIMAWSIGAGTALLGIGAIAVFSLVGHSMSRDWLAAACAVLAALGLGVGLLSIGITSRSVGEPLVKLRDALEAVEVGNLDTHVAVDDGSEVGLLQAGFNRMVSGLREREQLREAFGTYVDPAVTDRILDEGVNLAGEELDVSVLFLDVRGFTSFAEQAPPTEVVARLNELFDLAVPIVVQHHGHANKFIGDGLLAVFGAPERRPDHPRCAVACALEIAHAVNARFGGATRVGIGVNTGPAVVGTVGGGGRLEFTVIGDTVNTAARVEAATRITGDDVLITETTLQHLGDATGWAQRPPVQLKGKERTVALYAYAPTEASASVADKRGQTPAKY